MAETQYDSGKIRDSIRTLREFYSGILALALYEAIRGVAEAQDASGSYRIWFFLCAFCPTLIPFYHGTIRYFDDNYLAGSSEPKPRPLPLLFMFDYILFGAVGGFLVWMGAIFEKFNAGYFIEVYAGLLIMDLVWGFMTQFHSKSWHKVKRWFWLNFVVLAALVLGWELSQFWQLFQTHRIAMFLIVAPLRSILDYLLNWEFYFPKARREEPSEPGPTRAKPAPAGAG